MMCVEILVAALTLSASPARGDLPLATIKTQFIDPKAGVGATTFLGVEILYPAQPEVSTLRMRASGHNVELGDAKVGDMVVAWNNGVYLLPQANASTTVLVKIAAKVVALPASAEVVLETAEAVVQSNSSTSTLEAPPADGPPPKAEVSLGCSGVNPNVFAPLMILLPFFWRRRR